MPTTKLRRTDRDALERALVMACRESEQAARYEEMLRSKPWREAAESAAYSMQVKTLKLKPWQAPPCGCRSDEIGRGYGHSRGEVLLRRRMLAAGLSLYEPNPIAALEKIAAGAADTSAAPLESAGDPGEKKGARALSPGAKF
jgi:hypothetical protein